MCQKFLAFGAAVVIITALSQAVLADRPYLSTNEGLCALYEILSIEPEDPSLCSWELTERILFVTSGSYRAQVDFVGVGEADDICQMEAAEAGLKGKFKAWIADTSLASAPVVRFEHSTVPYMRPDGVIVAGDWEHLASESGHKAPINVHADGTTLDEGDPGYVWTNVKIDGTPSKTEPEAVCGHWTVLDSGYRGIVGTALATDYRWTEKGFWPCDASAYLYCVQQAN